LLQTSDDVAVPQEVGHWLAAEFPNATLDIIATKGHLPHMTASAEVQQILELRLQALTEW